MFVRYSIVIKSKHWPIRLLKIKKIIKIIARYKEILSYNAKLKYYCNIVLTNDFLIKKLNKTYKKQNISTDVLTFVSKIKKNSVIEKHCDIIISAETLFKDARLNKKNFYDHFTHLIIHSILHINGYSHNKNNDSYIMKNKEIEILNKIGIPNPYI